MSYRIVFTPRSLSDLQDIRDYIAKRSPLNAIRYLERLLDELDTLETLPNGCPLAIENDLVPFELRQFIVKPYRILYRVKAKDVQILHIRHAARNPAKPDDLA